MEFSLWSKNAACRGLDPDLFFPVKGEKTDEAKAVCEDCPVQEECLEYAVKKREKHGIWGGASERERRKIITVRRLANRAISNAQGA